MVACSEGCACVEGEDEGEDGERESGGGKAGGRREERREGGGGGEGRWVFKETRRERMATYHFQVLHLLLQFP